MTFVTTEFRRAILALPPGRFTSDDARRIEHNLRSAHLKKVACVIGTFRCALQRLRDDGYVRFLASGLYERTSQKDLTASTIQDSNDSQQQENKVTDTAFQAAFARAEAKAAQAPDRLTKIAKHGFTFGNVVPVTSIQTRKTETFDFPESGRKVPIERAFFRPSDFVANIASVANPGLGYQRRPQDRMAKMNAIARKFKPYLLAPFHAWINENGVPELLDALGRTFVCLYKINPPYNEPIETYIHLDVTNRQQAAVRFRELNPPEVTKVGVRGIFLSRLAEGDPIALTVSEQAREGGLVVGSAGRDGISVQAAEALHQMGMLKQVGLLKINGEWAHKLANPYYIGLGGYLLATADNSQILRDMMRATSVQMVIKELHSLYDASTPHARLTAARFARAMLSLRNYKRSHNRVTANWQRVDSVMAEPPFSDRWGTLKE